MKKWFAAVLVLGVTLPAEAQELRIDGMQVINPECLSLTATNAVTGTGPAGGGLTVPVAVTFSLVGRPQAAGGRTVVTVNCVQQAMAAAPGMINVDLNWLPIFTSVATVADANRLKDAITSDQRRIADLTNTVKMLQSNLDMLSSQNDALSKRLAALEKK